MVNSICPKCIHFTHFRLFVFTWGHVSIALDIGLQVKSNLYPFFVPGWIINLISNRKSIIYHNGFRISDLRYMVGRTRTETVFNIETKKRRRIRRILNQFEACKAKGTKYDGRDYRKNNRGRPTMIEPGSRDEALVADWLEENLGFRKTTEFLNQHRSDEGRLPVGRSAVMNCFNRMNPRIDLVQKVVQGGDSRDWEGARERQWKRNEVKQGKR